MWQIYFSPLVLAARPDKRMENISVTFSVPLSVPGFGLHALHTTPKRYAISVNGPWRVTFEWMDGDAWRVDLEQYH
jgi:proteic killer suppression protein